MNCLIVDDEPLALNLLKNYAGQVDDLQVLEATTDVFAALKLARETPVDLVFLDIQMPELTGIQFMKVLDGKSKVILTTAYEEYALQAFEHDVVDYLLKPFSLDRFRKAVAKARERIYAVSNPPTPAISNLTIKSGYQLMRVDINTVLYFEGLRDYVAVHTTDGNKMLTQQPLKSFETLLQHNNFLRVHKSYIIAMDKITRIENRRVTIGNIQIPVSDTYWPVLKAQAGIE